MDTKIIFISFKKIFDARELVLRNRDAVSHARKLVSRDGKLVV